MSPGIGETEELSDLMKLSDMMAFSPPTKVLRCPLCKISRVFVHMFVRV